MRKLKYLILSLFYVACQPDEIGPQEVNPNPPVALEGKTVFVINEGNFQRGNASISAYDPIKKEVNHKVFSSLNENLPLGDVAQDLQEYGGYYFISLNNSGKTIVLDTASWQQIASIDNLQTPRYLSFHQNRAFIGDLYASKLWVCNLSNYTIESSINLPSPGFHTTNWNGFIAIGCSKKLVLINPQTLAVDSTLSLPNTTEGIISDKQGYLWINCKTHLVCLDEKLNIILNWEISDFIANSELKFLSYNQNQHLYFLINQSIYKQHTNDSLFEPIELIELNNQNVYGFDVNPKNGDLYLADALDFDQASDIYRFSSGGDLLDVFKAGIIANGFYFRK